MAVRDDVIVGKQKCRLQSVQGDINRFTTHIHCKVLFMSSHNTIRSVVGWLLRFLYGIASYKHVSTLIGGR